MFDEFNWFLDNIWKIVFALVGIGIFIGGLGIYLILKY